MIKPYHKCSWIWTINFFRLPAYEPNIPHMERRFSFVSTKITSKTLGALMMKLLSISKRLEGEEKKKICCGIIRILYFLTPISSFCASGPSKCGLWSCGKHVGKEPSHQVLEHGSWMRTGGHCSSWLQWSLRLSGKQHASRCSCSGKEEYSLA